MQPGPDIIRDWEGSMSAEGSRDAFVLTGSGANAAYEVGVMKALLRGKWGTTPNPPVDPFCYSGTSMGALNAAVMVSQTGRPASEALDFLENLWLERIAVESASSATGLFRVRAEPSQYLSTGTYASNPLKPLTQMGADMFYFAFQILQRAAYATASASTLADGAVQVSELSAWLDFSPLRELVSDSINSSSIASSEKKLLITALNWESGNPKVFENQSFEGREGNEIILAALAMPVMMQPVIVDGVPYVDASVLSDMPIKPAIRAAQREPQGSLSLHTIYVDSQRSALPLPPISNTFATVYRLFILALARAVNADIARAELVNERIRMLELLNSVAAGSGRSLDEVIEELSIGATDIWNDIKGDTTNKLPVTVHRFRPTKNIRHFELIQFERRRIRQLIQDGYDDALRHDCNASECVRPRIRTAATTPVERK
jgi:predicted acylesterase/phospholipase RssA